MTKDKKFFTVEQFLEYIGVNVLSKGSVYRGIKSGNIPCKTIGNRKLIPAEWVYTFCDEA